MPQSIAPVQKRVTASPVDTFVKPAAHTGDGGFGQLAQSLSSLRPRLQQYMDQQLIADTKDEKLKGELDALKNKKVDPVGSPVYKMSYEQRQGRNEGMKYHSSLNTSYNEYMSNPPDDGDFAGWVGKTRDAYLGNAQRSQSFLAGFEETSAKAENKYMNKYQNDITKIRVDRQDTEVFDEFQNVAEMYGAGMLTQEELVQSFYIDPSVEKSYNLLDGKTLTTSRVDAVIEVARRTGNSDLLDVLDMTLPDGTPPPSSTKYGSAQVQLARDSIAAKEVRDASRAHLQETRKKKEEIDALLLDGTMALLEDPDADITATRNKALTLDPRMLSTFSSLETYVQGTPDDFAIGTLEAEVFDGTLKDKSTIINRLIAANASHRTIRDVLKDSIYINKNGTMEDKWPWMKTHAKQMTKIVSGGEEINFAGSDVALKVMDTQRQYLRIMNSYSKDNPDATEGDAMAYSAKITRQIGLDNGDIAQNLRTPITPADVTQLPPELVPYQTKAIFQSTEALKAAVAEYEASQGASGSLVTMARWLDITPNELALAQDALLANGN